MNSSRAGSRQEQKLQGLQAVLEDIDAKYVNCQTLGYCTFLEALNLYNSFSPITVSAEEFCDILLSPDYGMAVLVVTNPLTKILYVVKKTKYFALEHFLNEMFNETSQE